MRVLSTALALLSTTAPALAQCEIQRLVDPSGFATAGAILDGRAAMVNGSGQVTLFDATPQGWLPAGSMTVPGFILFELPSVAAHGDRVIAGNEEDVDLEGRAYLREGAGPWMQLVGSDTVGLDGFGTRVAVLGDMAVVTADMAVYDVGSCGPGKSYVFERDSSGTWLEVARFAPHHFRSVVTSYGTQLETDGATIVIGSPTDDQFSGGGFGTGAVYVYERDANGWNEAAKLGASDAHEGMHFGASAAVDGDRILVGAPGLGAGAVYAFERQTSGWVEVQRIEPQALVAGDSFGAGLDLEGDHAVVGAPWVDAANQNVGALYFLEHGPGGWVNVNKRVALDANANARFGSRVSMDDHQVLWMGTWQSEARLDSLGIRDQVVTCNATPNSTGQAATLGAEGCDSLIANALTLRAEGLPGSTFGLFFYGANPNQLPLGNGTLCIASPRRLPLAQADPSGVMRCTVDFQSPQAAAVTAGATWYFQNAFRDVGVGTGLDLSGAVAVDVRY